MKKFILLFLIFILFSATEGFSEPITGGISITDNIPQDLYGSWSVIAVQTYTNNPKKYDSMPCVEYWNIYRHANVLTLENPQSGANASVTVKEIKNNQITFTRQTNKQNREITETPTIVILGENFIGTDKMLIKNYKDGALVSTDVVEFMIQGRKIGGKTVESLLK